MSLAKPPTVVIDSNSPWLDDPFDRSPHGIRLFALVRTLRDSSYVIALNGDWGTGKSVFLQRLQVHFERSPLKIPFIRIDAWLSDDAEDPLIPFVAAIDARIAAVQPKSAQKRKGFVKAAAKLAVPSASLIANLVAPGSGSAIASAAKFGEAIIEWEQQKVAAAAQFRQSLKEARDLLTGRRDGEPITSPIVIAIDELDRCRPDFSVRALERIKHFFNVPGVVFLIATDRGNLPAAVQSVYGQAIDGERYLRKFFDYEYRLPEPTAAQYVNVLWREFKLDEVLPEGNHPLTMDHAFANGGSAYTSHLMENRNALDAFEYRHFFTSYADALGLSLRDQAQAFTMLSAHVRTTPRGAVNFPVVDCLVVCMRFSDPALFRDVQLGRFSFQALTMGSSNERNRASAGLPRITAWPQAKALALFFDAKESDQLFESLKNEVQQSRARQDEFFTESMVRLANRVRLSNRSPTQYVQDLLGLLHAFDPGQL